MVFGPPLYPAIRPWFARHSRSKTNAAQARHTPALRSFINVRAAGATSGGFFIQLMARSPAAGTQHHLTITIPILLYNTVAPYSDILHNMGRTTIGWRRLLAVLWILLLPVSALLLFFVTLVCNDSGTLFTKISPGDFVLAFLLLFPVSLLVGIVDLFRYPHSRCSVLLPIPLL
jgi:hypothetical protein